MVHRIYEKRSIMKNVENYIKNGENIIDDYRKTLESLKEKKIHKKLIRYLYEDEKEENHVHTLYDWANIQELEIIEKSLVNELEQLSVSKFLQSYKLCKNLIFFLLRHSLIGLQLNVIILMLNTITLRNHIIN